MTNLKGPSARSAVGSFGLISKPAKVSRPMSQLWPMQKSILKAKQKSDALMLTKLDYLEKRYDHVVNRMKEMDELSNGLLVLQISAVDDRRATKALIEETPIRGLDQVKDKLRRRGVEAVLSGTEWLKAKEVGDRAAPLAENKHSLVSRWQKAGKIFAIERAGVKYYPNYIFDALGNPIPEVAEVLKSFEGYTPIRVASWFESTSSAAGGKRPRELLSNEPKSVIELARKHVEGALHG